MFWFVEVIGFGPPPRQHANPILEIQRIYVKYYSGVNDKSYFFFAPSCENPSLTQNKLAPACYITERKTVIYRLLIIGNYCLY